MPLYLQRSIDPTPETLDVLLDEAFASAVRAAVRRGAPHPLEQPDRHQLFEAIADKPEGTFFWDWLISWRHPPSLVIGVAWWTDGVGRRHWYVETASKDEDSTFCRQVHGEQEIDLTRDRPPLAWFAPELSWCWRERGEQREMLVLCGCGLAGTLAQMAWTGECCGPCFDRQAEGLPVEHLPVLHPVAGPVLLLAFPGDGRLLSWVRESDDGESVKSSLCLWQRPWLSGEPLWRRAWHGALPRALACNGRLIALTDKNGERLLLLDLETGEEFGQPPSVSWNNVLGLAFVGPEQGLLVEVRSTHYGPSALSAWECSPAGTARSMRYQLPGAYRAIAAHPDHPWWFVAAGRRGVFVLDALSGQMLERFPLQSDEDTRGLAVTSDGAVLAVLSPWGGFSGSVPPWDAFTGTLVRWRPTGRPPAIPGRFGWLKRTPVQVAERSRPIEGERYGLAVSPDGAIAASASTNELVFWDARSLEERARIKLDTHLCSPLAFSPDGTTLLVGSSHGLLLLPWRDLLG